jgi:histidine triad (HIT) family protein
MNCIFCKIISGEASSSKVYEDAEVLAFMDIQPVRPGQVLVIPKVHIDHFTDIPGELAEHIFRTAFTLAGKVRSVLNPERVGLVVHGYGVSHAHMVIVPQHTKDDITSARIAEIREGEVVFDMHILPMASREDLDVIAASLRGE